MAVQSGAYLTNPTAEIAKVKTVMQACIDLGIYCQIDYHETANGMDNLSKAQTLVHVPRPKGHQLVQLVGFGYSGSVRDSSTQSSIRLCQRRLGRKRFKTIGKVRENLFTNSKSGDRAVIQDIGDRGRKRSRSIVPDPRAGSWASMTSPERALKGSHVMSPPCFGAPSAMADRNCQAVTT